MEQLNENRRIDQIVALMGDLTTEQLIELEKKAKEKRLCDVEKAQKKQTKAISKLNKKVEDLETTIEDHKKALDKLNILATDDSKMFVLQETVKCRVMSQVKENYMKILFKDKFFAKCWGELKEKFDVPKYSHIKIADYELALNTVQVWKPSPKYIRDEIKKYQDLQNSEKGDLLKPRVSKALDLYIEKHNN